MKAKPRQIYVGGIEVEVVRKRIRNLNLRVCSPEGRVCMSVPTHVDDAAVRRFVSEKLDWILKQQVRIRSRVRSAPLELVTGDWIDFFGERYRLCVTEGGRSCGVFRRDGSGLELVVVPGADRAQREAVLYAWYRTELKARIPSLIAEWEPVLQVSVSEWGVKRMKTRWGSCNYRARRIWLNLELAKKAPACLEYVVVHEMVHLLEPSHNKRFYGFMDQFLPSWRERKARLNIES
jgi:predicted metal-dependent hydrolase